ncbi:MAG TPA: imidazole glycerol phosphate synthase subunit HisH [Spirochaetota bacterium]|nr:imidazole glycerol phosphate synthase subunit HisH [Spirochaetota bacterium]
MITVVDYGMGNLRSVVKAVEKYTTDVRVSSDPESIRSSDGLVMPGDGAFGMAMQHLVEKGWVSPLREFIAAGGYFLGICLGYQLLFESSAEFGHNRGLGVIPGRVVRFESTRLKVPHMGWNSVELSGSSQFLAGIDQGSYFYFIHSYYPTVDDTEWILGEVEYGVRFPCIVGRGNLVATQFHPEKSHRTGLRIVENFVRAVCS